MNTKNESIPTLRALLYKDVRKIASAEMELSRELSGWLPLAVSLQLKVVLQKYLTLVQQHIAMLERFLDDEGVPALGQADKIMQVLMQDTYERLQGCEDVTVRDACLLSSIQLINHVKISQYGTAAAFANILQMDKAAAAIHEAEIDEKHIDDRLSQLAAFEVNTRAKAPHVLSS